MPNYIQFKNGGNTFSPQGRKNTPMLEWETHFSRCLANDGRNEQKVSLRLDLFAQKFLALLFLELKVQHKNRSHEIT